MMRNILAVGALMLLFSAGVGYACDCTSAGGCTCAISCPCGSTSASSRLPAQMKVPLTTVVAPADASGTTTTHIDVMDFSFSANATIQVGDSIEWDWVGGIHTVTSVAGSSDPFNSGVQTSGTFTHTFNEPGTYWYYCQIHGTDNGDGTASGMAATVTVMPAPEPATAGLAAMAACGLLMRRRRQRKSF